MQDDAHDDAEASATNPSGAPDAPVEPHAASLPGYLARRYHAWRQSSFEENSAWYAHLAADGQHPRTMVIQCCDSRFDLTDIFGAEPGDLFVLRNIANLVPPYGPDQFHHGTSSALEFAVNVAKVAHIVVVGHSGCGGVGACHDMCSGRAPELESATSFIGRWMDILRPAYRRVAARVPEVAAQKAAFEREAVLVSLANLETFPFVTEAREAGMLTLHGAWFDIGAGRLHAWSAETGFAPV